MIKTNLPAILLRGIILLPNNEIRLEFDNEETRNIIDVSNMFHDDEILVVSQIDPIEEALDINNLPNIGVISKISHRIELPNGKTRITLCGIKRAYIHEYLNLNHKDEVLESIISKIIEEKIDKVEETIIIRKLYEELENHIKIIPYIDNSFLSQIKRNIDLSSLTDIVVPNIVNTNERIFSYLSTLNPKIRAEMILEDIYKQQESFRIEMDLDSKVKDGIEKTQKDYFLREKIKLIKEELGEVENDKTEQIREKVISSLAPDNIKNRLFDEVRKMKSLSNFSPELNVVSSYIDWLLKLPWGIYTKDFNDLSVVKKKLDSSHQGLEKVKARIIEYLALKKVNKNCKSPILCLVGPPGVGKTTLAFSIASAMKRNFVKVSVGGVNDAAEIKGHRKTYIGSSPGRIIQSLKKSKSFNPVFLIDEIDKMNSSYKEDPTSALLEVLDPEQNKYFSDNYIEEEIDLSNIMFIATANYIEDIPEALFDRLEIIEISGYTEFEKLDIAKNYIIPKIITNYSLKKSNIKITDNIILSIIRFYTKESGVRDLERKLETIFRKIVTDMVLRNRKSITKEVTEENIEEYLGKKKYHFSCNDIGGKIGVVNGLAYTNYGGDTLPIEVTTFKGNGSLILTGSLGEVMKESAQIALSYIKSNYEYFKIDYEQLLNHDIHIHIPEGAVRKDGPSAGISLVTAIISLLTKKTISKLIAMTGEVTLNGEILEIGGLKEKCIGANRNGIKKIIIPFSNINDIDDIPNEVKENLEFIPVKNYKEVWDILKR